MSSVCHTPHSNTRESIKKACYAPENNSIYSKQQRWMFSWRYSTRAGDSGDAAKGTAFNSFVPKQHRKTPGTENRELDQQSQFAHLLLKPIAGRAMTMCYPAPPRAQEGRREALVPRSSGGQKPARTRSSTGAAARPSAAPRPDPGPPHWARYRSPPALPGPPPARSANRVLPGALSRHAIG